MTVARLQPAQVNERLVTELEHLLKQAKNGTLTGAAWGAIYLDGEASTGWALDFRANRHTVVGVLDAVKYDLMTTLSLNGGVLSTELYGD